MLRRVFSHSAEVQFIGFSQCKSVGLLLLLLNVVCQGLNWNLTVALQDRSHDVSDWIWRHRLCAEAVGEATKCCALPGQDRDGCFAAM